MNPRQRYALTHPITDPTELAVIAQIRSELYATRRHPKGNIIHSILAVDR